MMAQRAMVAARALPLFKAEAKERQVRKPESVSANLREQNNCKASEKAAETVNVSARRVESASASVEGCRAADGCGGVSGNSPPARAHVRRVAKALTTLRKPQTLHTRTTRRAPNHALSDAEVARIILDAGDRYNPLMQRWAQLVLHHTEDEQQPQPFALENNR